MINCPKCSGPVQSSERFVPGHPAYACRSCRLWWVDGHADPIKPGQDLAKAIRLVLGIVEEKRTADEQMMESDISDPRWLQIS